MINKFLTVFVGLLFLSKPASSQTYDSLLFNKVYDYSSSQFIGSSGFDGIEINDTLYVVGLAIIDTIVEAEERTQRVIYISAIDQFGDEIWRKYYFDDKDSYIMPSTGAIQRANDSILKIFGCKLNTNLSSERDTYQPIMLSFNLKRSSFNGSVLFSVDSSGFISLDSSDFFLKSVTSLNDSIYYLVGFGFSFENSFNIDRYYPINVYNGIIKVNIKSEQFEKYELNRIDNTSNSQFAIDFGELILMDNKVLFYTTLFNKLNSNVIQYFTTLNTDLVKVDEREFFNEIPFLNNSGSSLMKFKFIDDRLYFTSRYAETDDRGNVEYSVPLIGELGLEYDTLWMVEAPIKEYGFRKPIALYKEQEDFIICGMNFNDFKGNAYILKMDSLGVVDWYREYRYKEGSYSEDEILNVYRTNQNYYFIGNMFNQNFVQDTLELLGQYTWIVKTDSIGCLTEDCAINVPNTLDQDSELDNISIYPNPASDIVQLDLKGIKTPLSFRIYDMQGKFRYELVNILGSQQIQLPSFLQSGMYIVIVVSENGVEYSQKLMVKR